jgi:hypothetical protein
MRRWLQATLILGLLCCWVSGCGPTYGYYDSPGYGYAPYSYRWPTYARGYTPVFAEHHAWEEHHIGEGHHQTFWHGGLGRAEFGGGHPGGFGGGGHVGGHGGGGHR